MLILSMSNELVSDLLYHIFQSYFIPLLASVFFLVFISASKNFDSKLIKLFNAITFVIVGLVFADAGELIFSYFDHPTIFRAIFAASAYSLRVFVLYTSLLLFFKDIKKVFKIIFIVPALFNTVVSFMGLFNPNVFYYTDNNVLVRGPWIIVPFAVSFFYFIIYFIFALAKFKKGFKLDIVLILGIFVSSVITTFLEVRYGLKGLLSSSCIISVIFYYIAYLLINYSRDALTGCYVRNKLYTNIKHLHKYSLIILDINELKKMNDTLGHLAGDRCLKAVCNRVRESIPINSEIYRMGGDEFVVILKTTNIDEVIDISRTIKSKVELDKFSIAIGYSIREDDSSFDDLFTQADKMLYQDKEFYKTQLKGNNIQ